MRPFLLSCLGALLLASALLAGLAWASWHLARLLAEFVSAIR